jgi:hypothetical protein
VILDGKILLRNQSLLLLRLLKTAKQVHKIFLLQSEPAKANPAVGGFISPYFFIIGE